ncbi:MAG: sensor histidine kinase [Burkholderiales bacterium]|nr:sensor histidine kinase [Burkholderiales bacterium]
MTSGHRQSPGVRPAATGPWPGLAPQASARLAWIAAQAPILFTLLVLVLLGWAAVTIASDLVTVAHIEDRQLPKLELIQEAKYADLVASVALGQAVMAQDRAQARDSVDRYAEFDLRAQRALSRIEATTRAEANKARVRSVLQAHDALLAARGRVLMTLQDPSGAPLQDAQTKALDTTLNAYLARLQVLYDAESRNVGKGIADALVKTMRARGLVALAGVLALLAVLQQLRVRFRAARESVARKDREIEVLQRQRDGLVREVHHRIKNHLQGLLTLIEGGAAGDPAAAAPLQTLEGHVLALINVHGLQAGSGPAGGGAISLRELVANQLPLIEASFPSTTVKLDAAADTQALLDSDQAVPVALAVTELIVNGLKHGVGAQVAVAISSGEGLAAIAITNRVAAPPDFDWERRVGLGTGLQLLASLLLGIGRIDQGPNPPGELTMTIHLETARA